MTLTKAAVFAAGYVLGAKAGRERYAQIVEIAARASQRLEELSSRGAAGSQETRPRRRGGRA